MASNTFTKIASVTVGSGGTTSIDFTSIPATYTDLCVVISGRAERSDIVDYFDLSFNGSTSNRSMRALYFSGTAKGSVSDTTIYGAVDAATNTASTFASTSIYISNYASSDYKPVSFESVAESNTASSNYGHMGAGLWSSTSAITSLTIPTGNNTKWVQYTTATLYGIKNS